MLKNRSGALRLSLELFKKLHAFFEFAPLEKGDAQIDHNNGMKDSQEREVASNSLRRYLSFDDE